MVKRLAGHIDDALFVAGFGCVVTGIALLSVPVALIVAGAVLLVLGRGLSRIGGR